jgi:hypothetical protein
VLTKLGIKLGMEYKIKENGPNTYNGIQSIIEAIKGYCLFAFFKFENSLLILG